MKHLLIGIALSLPVAAVAEDVGTIVATLNDPQAECRYLAEKNFVQRAAQREYDEAMREWGRATQALEEAPKNSQERQNLVQAVEVTQDHAQQTGASARLAAAGVRAIESVIRARRGSLEQCQNEIEKLPVIEFEKSPGSRYTWTP
jgi:hypothetical protein